MLKNLLRVSFFLLLVVLTSCKGCSNKKTKPISEPKVKEISKVNFFLETSASMKGYLSGSSDFVKFIPNLLVDIEGRVNFLKKPLNINFINGDSVQHYKGSTADFIHDISTTQVATAKSSQMHNIFEMVTNATDSNDISLLVSDCILSYTDEEIKKRPTINIEKADGELKAFIKQAFLKMKAKNICANVYGFNSTFFGTYYSYDNTKFLIKGNVNRPFYLWIVGNKELVSKFCNTLQEFPDFKHQLAISFGMFEYPISNYNLLFKTGKEGSWSYDNNNLKETSITKNKAIRFSIAVNFNKLPPYAKDINYLKANFKLAKTNMEAKILDIKKASEIDFSKAAPKEKSIIQDATHIISFEVTDLYQTQGTLGLNLPLLYDTGYKNWSTMNDKSISLIENKTFAFEHLVNGVKEAYQTTNENYFNISINLKK